MRNHSRGNKLRSSCKDSSQKRRMQSGSTARTNLRATTPVVQKKEVFFSVPKQSKHAQGKDVAKQIFSSHENIPTNKFFLKMSKSDELESIEKDKGEFSTVSIEQDIANLEQIKNVGGQGEHFVFEFDESEEQFKEMKLMTQKAENSKEKKNVFKNQPNQVRNYIGPGFSDKKSLKSQKERSISPFPTEKEIENKRMIMEYLRIVKDKIAFMDKKLEEVSREAEYYKIKSAEMEASRDKVIEKEKLMAMKYGIILSQNKELITKLK